MLDTLSDDRAAIVDRWLNRFERALTAGDATALDSLLLPESYWRDVLALTWRFATVAGSSEIAGQLAASAVVAKPHSFAIDGDQAPVRQVTRIGKEVIEAFFRFETETGRGQGIVRLAPATDGDEDLRGWTIFTGLDELKGHEERLGANRPTGQSHSRDFRGPNWLDQRTAAQAYADSDPAVLIVGGGQAGLATAARLTQLGVDALIIDKHERIGDNWRKRYHALTLHNQVQVNHLPYMPFPDTWPTYIPKDKLANWFEAYVDALELNYWTGSELVGGRYDDGVARWTATVRRSDGSERTLRPQHIVMATGVSGIANRPHIATLDKFEGQLVHSSEYQDGEDWTGRNAIIIGTGNSGHDIAHDLTSSGAKVTLVQRNPTLVVNIEPSAQLPYALYSEGRSLENCDLITTSMPTPLVRRAHQEFTRQARELDKPLLDRLDKIGFKLDFGEDDTGWQFKYLTRGGGYYFNVGCSDMLADGEIDLMQFDQIESFTPTGASLVDGRQLDADLIVLSTGYLPQERLVEHLFGNEVAGRVGPIWGFGEGDELRNMYCRTGQPGLWFIAGSLAQCRINSKYLALQIKACEEGIIAKEV